jgi:EF-hand domain pair
MSKKVFLIAGVVLAAGSVAAVSSPYFRDGQLRLGRMLDQFSGGDGDEAPRGWGRQRREIDADGTRLSARSGRHARVSDQEVEDDNEGFTKTRRGRMREADEEERRQDMGDRLWRWFGGRDRDRRDADAEPGLGRGRKEGSEPRRASSERQTGRADRRFVRLDRNGDGVIDAKDFEARAAEIVAAATRRFLERYDADGDGKVSREEFERVAKESPRDRVADLEFDGEDKMGGAETSRQPRRDILK